MGAAKGPNVQRAGVLAAAAAATLGAANASAEPTGASVTAGQVSLDASLPGHLRIDQLSDRAVINWQSFSIGEGESVQFRQPGGASSVLNRVVGAHRSVLDGALKANGNVFLVNRSGILIGAKGQIDVGGFLATTSDIADADFLAGRYSFHDSTGATGSVINNGRISVSDGGLAALVAPSVANHGIIAAKLGKVVLGGGSAFTLDLYGDDLFKFAVGAKTSGAASVEQGGAINAEGGRVLLTSQAAQDVVTGVINMSGIVQAGSARQDGGDIVLFAAEGTVNVSGALDASSAAGHGGQVEVLGRAVHLNDGAQIATAGASGGGNVFIGGDERGIGTRPQATHVSIASGAAINASAGDLGDGGKVIVWSKGSTAFRGLVRAQGGANGGNGGFVEISGGDALQVIGEVLNGASQGAAGTLLLDPSKLIVAEPGIRSDDAPVVSANFINERLRQGLPIALVATDQIAIASAIDGRALSASDVAGGSVTLSAAQVLLLAPVITSNGAIELNAGAGGISFSADAFLLVAASSQANALGSANVLLRSSGSIEARQIATLGRINVQSMAGGVSLLNALAGLDVNGTATGIGTLEVSANGDIVTNGVLSSSAAVDRAPGISLVSATGGVKNASGALISDRWVMVDAGGAVNLGSVTSTSRDISIQAGGAVSAGSLLVGSGGAVHIEAGGSVTLSEGLYGLPTVAGNPASAGAGIGTLIIDAGTDVSMRGAKTNSTSALQVTAGGQITNGTASGENQALVSAGDIKLTARNGGITLNGSGSSPGVDAAGAVTLVAKGGVKLGQGVRARSGDILIGCTTADAASCASADAVGGLSGSAGTDNAAVVQADIGKITVRSTGDVLGNNFVTNGAAVDIKSTAGDVRVSQALNGSSDGIGALTIDANRDVALNGVLTKGGAAISVTAGGAISNGPSGALVSSGDVVLNATGEGDITIAGTGASAGIQANGAATLRTSGDVLLDRGVVALGGRVSIGCAAGDSTSGCDGTEKQVASFGGVTAGTAAAALEAANGNITVRSSGAVAASDLRTGTAGAVDVRSAGDVSISEALYGLEGASATEGDGIGSLTLVGKSVALNGAKVTSTTLATPVQITATNGAITNGRPQAATSSIIAEDGDIVLDAAGGISLISGASTTGDIGIEAKSGAVSLTAGDDVTLAQGIVASGDITIVATNDVLANDLVTGSAGVIDITSSAGSVFLDKGLYGHASGALFDGIGSLNVAAASQIWMNGVQAETVNTGGVTLDADDRIVIAGAISSKGPVTIGDLDGTVASTARISLNHNVFTYQQPVRFVSPVVLLDGITRDDIWAALANSDLTFGGRFVLAPTTGTNTTNGGTLNGACNNVSMCGDPLDDRFQDPFDALYQLEPKHTASALASLCVNGGVGGPQCSTATYFANCGGPQCQRLNLDSVGGAFRFTQDYLFAVDASGTPQSLFVQPINYGYTDFLGEKQLAHQRQDVLQRLLGAATITVDTTLTGGGVPADSTRGTVTFDRGVNRYNFNDYYGNAPPQPHQVDVAEIGGIQGMPAGFSAFEDLDCDDDFCNGRSNGISIYPSFVNHALVVKAGDSSVVMSGNLGAADGTELALSTSNGVSGTTNGVALLGTFTVDINTTQPFTPSDTSLDLNYFNYNGSTYGGFVETVPVRSFSYAETNYSGVPPPANGGSYSAASTFSFAGPAFSAGGSYAPVSASGGPVFTTVGTGQGASSGAAGQAQSAPGTIETTTVALLTPDQASRQADEENAAEDSETSAKPEKPENASGEPASEAGGSSCPRGASRSADLGNQPPAEGAADDVFSRCSADVGK